MAECTFTKLGTTSRNGEELIAGRTQSVCGSGNRDVEVKITGKAVGRIVF